MYTKSSTFFAKTRRSEASHPSLCIHWCPSSRGSGAEGPRTTKLVFRRSDSFSLNNRKNVCPMKGQITIKRTSGCFPNASMQRTILRRAKRTNNRLIYRINPRSLYPAVACAAQQARTCACSLLELDRGARASCRLIIHADAVFYRPLLAAIIRSRDVVVPQRPAALGCAWVSSFTLACRPFRFLRPRGDINVWMPVFRCC